MGKDETTTKKTTKTKQQTTMTTGMTTSIPPSLTKRLIVHKHPKQRISNDAVHITSELLRLFVVEARKRAAVEAECESEVNQEVDASVDGIRIKAHHVTKIAAELLMDFS